MYNHIGVRQLDAFAARAVLRLPDVRVLDVRVLDSPIGPIGPAPAPPARPPADRGAPPTPIEP